MGGNQRLHRAVEKVVKRIKYAKKHRCGLSVMLQTSSTGGSRCDTDLLKLISNGFGFFVPLKPHHVLCVEPPWLFLQSFGCQILGLSALQRGRGGGEEEGQKRVEEKREETKRRTDSRGEDEKRRFNKQEHIMVMQKIQFWFWCKKQM